MPEPVQSAQVPPQKGLTAMTGAMALMVVLLIVQIWLLSAALESYLAGNVGAALPAAVISGVIFMCCLGLFIFVERVDADVHRPAAPDTTGHLLPPAA